MSSINPAPVLVIGCGSTLRSDDGVGYRLAEAIAEWNLAQVRSCPVHQLTPELADDISRAATVIFIDAVDTTTDLVVASDTLLEFVPIALNGNTSATTTRFTAHYVTPETLLALAQELYQHSPQAYQLLIPTETFEIGETFSALTDRYYHQALKQLQAFLVSV